ncbi:MAG: ATP synthase F1 subunit delta [Patescibacteria group bacterium]|nr:ATP synthase F1 subunit delta [Patescibacteria group bacterium]
MKRITPKHYAILLYELTEGLTHQEIDAVMKKFVHLLADRNQISLAERIAAEFHRYSLIKENITEGELVTAQALSVRDKKIIEEALAKLLKQTVRLNESIDATLLGGIMVRFPDLLIDASLKNRLANLKESMISAN